jgi:hypothetical protein
VIIRLQRIFGANKISANSKSGVLIHPEQHTKKLSALSSLGLGFQTLEADSAKLGLQRKLYKLGVKESLKPPAIEENRQAFDCQLSAQREEFFTFCLLVMAKICWQLQDFKKREEICEGNQLFHRILTSNP